jgi:hypothetical protein
MNKRNNKGQFEVTNGGQRYRNVQYKGIRVSEHCREMCIALGIFTIPKGFIIHHLDENKLNNDIHNLALMSITAHNRLHSHEAWNKGIRTIDNEKWRNTSIKAQISRRLFFKNKWKTTYDLRMSGKTFVEIGNILGICRETASNQFRQYKKLL